jgi:type VI protein secretion system component VasK
MWGRWAGRRADSTSEQLALEQEATNLRAELERIQSRLAEFLPTEKTDSPSRD